MKILGADSEEIDKILKVLSDSKSMSTPDLQEALKFLREISTEAPACFSISVDRKRKLRPYRLGFLGYEWNIGKTKIRVEGEEPHNGSSLIKLDEVDFTVVGLDELLSMTQHYLGDPTKVTKWGMYNYQLIKPTSIRVAGSAMLPVTTIYSVMKYRIWWVFSLSLKKVSAVEDRSILRHFRHTADMYMSKVVIVE